MSKRKAQTVSYDDAVADNLNWIENPDNDENLKQIDFLVTQIIVTKKETTSNLNRKKK